MHKNHLNTVALTSTHLSVNQFGTVALILDQIDPCSQFSVNLLAEIIYIYMYVYVLLFKGFPYLESLFFWFKNAPIPLCLSRDKTKG